MSRVHNELAKIRRERAREAAARPASDTPAATPTNPGATVDARLEQIARTTLGLETLETRRSDGLDFHDLAVWQIKQALQAAYEAGRASAK
jgi:hypothetical protein